MTTPPVITHAFPRDVRWLVALLALVLAVALVPARAAQAQPAPTGVSVEQGHGFATLSWDEVEGATTYQIERTPVDGDTPTGPGQVVGVWMPDRYSAQGRPGGELTFADAGFTLGERYRWRVRAVVGGSAGDWSEGVTDDTTPPPGPAEWRTGFEQSGGAEWTTHEEEVAFLEAVAAASPRVRVTQIGETYQGRPLHLATVGYPEPKDPAEIAESASVLIGCTVHGIERAPREACLILLRDLAFSDDPWVMGILSRATVLINPTTNPDGRQLGIRTNTADQDLNRDHIMLRHPETFGLSEVIRDHRPDLIIDGHELGTGPDLQWLWPRSPGVGEELWALAQDDMTRSWAFGSGAQRGWSSRIWPTHRLDNWETLLQNTAGLKNALGQLQESPRIPNITRPSEGGEGTVANQQRRVYSHLWGFRTHLDYHHDNVEMIRAAIAAAEAQHRTNAGPIYLDGGRDVPVPPPIDEPITAVLDPAPCGYRLSPQQYATRDSGDLIDGGTWTSPTVAERLEAHGIEVESVGAGIQQVRLAQRLRAVIPYALDPELQTPVRPQGLPNLSMVEATRLDDRRATVAVGGVATAVPNRVSDTGCSVNDLIADEQAWPNTGRFVQHVTAVTRDLVADGLLDHRERSVIVSAAGRSGIGR